MKYIYIILPIIFTVYGQIALKWQVGKLDPSQNMLSDKYVYYFVLLKNPWIWSSFLAAFLASLVWMAAVSKFDLSYAYPFMSVSFALVLFFSAVLFNEPVNLYKVLGIFFIILGVVITSRSA